MSQIKLVVYSIPFSLKELFRKAEVSKEAQFIKEKFKQFTKNGALPEYWITNIHSRTWAIHLRQGNTMTLQAAGKKSDLGAMISELPDSVIVVDKARRSLATSILNEAGHHVNMTTIQLPKKSR